jgi:hypothetical protein
MMEFRLYFNRRKQFVDVYLHPVTPGTFERRGGGRWAYYSPCSERSRVGLFGEIHIVESRVRPDVVSHELIHLLCDIMRSRGMAWTDRSEERIASVYDELVRSFWREYGKIDL